MAPKRPVPTGPTGAMAKGSAFRTSSSKKRKAESGENSAPAIPRTRPAPKSDNGKGKQKALPSKSVSTTAKKASNDSVKAPVTKPSQVRLAVTNGKQKATTLFVEQSSKASAIAAEKMKSATGKQDASIEMPTKADSTFDSFRIIVGSYERLLYGYNVTFAGEKKVTPKIDTIFSFAAHTSCISAVAAASADSKWLATGAGDETVRVWDLRKKKEVGGLVGHNGTILSLSFPARTYLLSADSSGLINLYRTRDWCLLKTLKGHTGKVNACVAHPSGKLALSVGQDGMLRMWDLMRGKGAGAVRLNLGQEEGTKTFKEEPLDVKWNQSGSRFVVMGRTEVVVYKTDMSRVASLLVRRDDPKSKFGCVEWQGGDVLLTGNESGVVGVYRLLESSIRGPVATLSGHANRVRAVRAIKLKHDEKDMVVVTTVSSDGKIRIFDITTVLTSDLKEEETMTAVELQPIGVQDTGGARLTCLDVVGGIGPNASSAAEGFEDGDDDEEEGESLDSDVDVSEEEEDGTLDKAEMEELNKLLDLVEEARRQGVEVEGLSEFEDAGSSDDGDEDDGEYDDEDEDEIQDEDEEELESEDEEEGEDDE